MPLLIILVVIFLGTYGYASYSGAPWLPTRKGDVGRALKLAGVNSGQKLYDLGCGDGRLIFAAAREGATAVGFEISVLPYLLAKVRILSAGVSGNCSVAYKSFWNVSMADADVVYVFLTPNINPRMKEKLEKELRKGAKVISYAFPIEGWQPLKVDKFKNRPDIYLYEI